MVKGADLPLTSGTSGIAEALPGQCIQQIFEAQAARTPDNVAVTCGEQRLSYRELNERSNRFAHYLRKQGVGPDVLVGICVDRTLDLVVGLLGILKAGGAYVPIDPQYPRERLAFMLEDSRSPLIVTQRSLGADLAIPDTRVIFIDEEWPAICREAATNPLIDMTPENLAYVIYTSGSTGVPKGMLISHQNVARLFSATQDWFHFTEADVWTLFHSCAFDFSVWELWGALFYGGKLVVVPFGVSRTPQIFYQLLCDEKVTVLNQTPSAFRQLIRAEEEAGARSDLSLRLVIFGGEALDFGTLKPWFDRHGDRQPQLINMYGITETTVHVTYRPISATDVGSSSVIGIPIPDLQIHILDEGQKPVLNGDAGEIYVGGKGVGRGYLNRPDLTAVKFVPDPFAAEAGRRLYRSGDLARYLPNGELEYLGRIDGQVKIRGFRIELGEIAAVLNSHAAVRESVVIASEQSPGDKILVAYVVTRNGVSVAVSELRQQLRARLPEYMVPAAFVFIERLPMTVNGKIDVKALPAPQKAPATPFTGGAPPSPGATLEQGIAAIWCDILQIQTVDTDQNFFDVGGTSIHLAEIHSRMQKLLGRQFSITELFSHSTIRGLATYFRGGGKPDGAADANRLRAQKQRDAMAAQRTRRRERT